MSFNSFNFLEIIAYQNEVIHIDKESSKGSTMALDESVQGRGLLIALQTIDEKLI